MAQVLTDSVIGYPQSLAIFSKAVQNVGIRKYRTIEYYPVNDFTTQGVIQFMINGNGASYIDLSRTLLNIKCKIVRRDGSNIAHATLVGLTDQTAEVNPITASLAQPPVEGARETETDTRGESGGEAATSPLKIPEMPLAGGEPTGVGEMPPHPPRGSSVYSITS